MRPQTRIVSSVWSPETGKPKGRCSPIWEGSVRGQTTLYGGTLSILIEMFWFLRPEALKFEIVQDPIISFYDPVFV